MTIPSEAVRVVVQLATATVISLRLKAHDRPLDKDDFEALVHVIDRLAALSLHVGDVSDVQSDALGATPAGSGSTLQPPSGASAAIPGADCARLMRFYAVDTLAALIDAQARHIEKLQAKLPPTPSLAAPRVREG